MDGGTPGNPAGDDGRAPAPFVGRRRESGLLGAVVAAAAEAGSARVVVGEPGIGRTTLLRHLADGTPHRVLWVRGSRAEAELPYAAAAQLLTGLTAYFARVPPAQRHAVEVALALIDGPAIGALAVCAGALGVLGAASGREPLLVLVDDLQWIDRESRRLLLYLARRLDRERVALVMALREEPGPAAEPPDVPTVRMAGLDRADGRRLARAHGFLAPDHEVDAIVDATGGNPRAVVETLGRLSAGRPGDFDHELAARLACLARRTGEPAVAARFLRRAAELTASPSLRATRLLAAAAGALRAGQGEQAASSCREAASLRDDPAFLAAAASRCARGLGLAGQHRQAYDELVSVASWLAPRDPARAARLLCEATVPAMVMGEARLACVAVMDAESLIGVPLPVDARASAGAARVMHGLPDGEAIAPELVGDPASLVQQAMADLWAERLTPARAAINAALCRARRGRSPSLLAVTLAVRSDLGYRTGGWVAAQADAVESIAVAGRTTPNGVIAFGLLALARLDAVRGGGERCAELLARSRKEAGPFGVDLRLLLEPAVRGLAALTAGEPGAALEPLESAWSHAEDSGVGNPNVVPFAADLAEAHARCGNSERAREVVSWLEERASGLRGPLSGAWRCRGLLATDVDEATAAFATARTVCDVRTAPFEYARTLLCEGEVLRRLRRPAAARPALRRAVDVFEGLGAVVWADRAAAELSAAGDHPGVKSGPLAMEVLTPQQFRIANLVAAGHNNVETATALFLSRKTVEAHLTQVYRKLGVHSRTQLTNALNASRP